jgi:GPH family glycoside/pentoside/hexuronide:cation symporter
VGRPSRSLTLSVDRQASRLPYSTVLAISAPTLQIGALGIALYVYIGPYYAGHLNVALTVVGLVWMAVRLVDIPADVVLAILMDRTKTRFGRYRLWLVASVPILALSTYQLFMAPVGVSAVYLFGWLLLLYFGMSMSQIAQSAWMAKLATTYGERSRIFAWQNALGVVGNLMVLAIVILPLGFTDITAVPPMGWLTLALTPTTILIASLLTPERISPEPPTRFKLNDYLQALTKPALLRLFLTQIALTLGPGWMSAIYLFFFTRAREFTGQQATILLAIYIVVQVPGAFLAGAMANWIGKHRALMVSTTAFSLGVITIFFIPHRAFIPAIPMMMWVGVAAIGFNLTVSAMLADVGDEIRLEQGKERISLVYAVNGLAGKIAAAFSIGVTYPLLQWLGFNPAEGSVNTHAALHNLELSFLIGPIVFVMLGGACVIGWRLDAKRHAEIRELLAARDAALEAEAGWPEPIAGPEIVSGAAE